MSPVLLPPQGFFIFFLSFFFFLLRLSSIVCGSVYGKIHENLFEDSLRLIALGQNSNAEIKWKK